jgi:hypothetical protein
VELYERGIETKKYKEVLIDPSFEVVRYGAQLIEKLSQTTQRLIHPIHRRI